MSCPPSEVKDHRRGRCFIIKEGENESYLEEVPMRPRGWLLRKDGKFMFSGVLFARNALDEKIKRIEEILAGRSKIGIPSELKHISNVKILPIDPPSQYQEEQVKDIMDDLPFQPVQPVQEQCTMPKLLPAAPVRRTKKAPKEESHGTS